MTQFVTQNFERLGIRQGTRDLDEHVSNRFPRRKQDRVPGSQHRFELSALNLDDEIRHLESIDDGSEGGRSLLAGRDEKPQIFGVASHVVERVCLSRGAQ